VRKPGHRCHTWTLSSQDGQHLNVFLNLIFGLKSSHTHRTRISWSSHFLFWLGPSSLAKFKSIVLGFKKSLYSNCKKEILILIPLDYKWTGNVNKLFFSWQLHGCCNSYRWKVNGSWCTEARENSKSIFLLLQHLHEIIMTGIVVELYGVPHGILGV
jgi:hypothetical protein